MLKSFYIWVINWFYTHQELINTIIQLISTLLDFIDLNR